MNQKQNNLNNFNVQVSDGMINNQLNPEKKMNLGLIIGLVIIVVIIIIGIIFGIKFSNKDNGSVNEKDLDHKEYNSFFSINDNISSKNNYFEYSNYKWEFLFDDFDSVSIWKGKIKNISNKTLKGNLRLKFYDSNNNVIGDVQKYDLIEEIDSSDVFILKPGEESNISFTYYSEELNDGYCLKDVKYISIEDIK